MSTLRGWKRRIVGGRSAITNYSPRYVRPCVLLVLEILMGIVPLQYDRVDPTEFQSLKDELETLKTEKSATESQRAAQAEELTQLQEKVCDLYYSSSIRL